MGLNRGRWCGEVKRLTDLSAREIELWRHLHTTRHELRSPFFSFEFAHAVARAGARARVCLLYEGGTLAGFFPFQYAGAPAQAMGVGERIGGFLSGFCGTIMDQSRYPRISHEDLLRCTGLGSLGLASIEESQRHLNVAAAHTLGARLKLVQEPEQYWGLVKRRHPTTYDNLRNRLRKIERDFRSVEFAFARNEPAQFLDLLVSGKREQYRKKGEELLSAAWIPRCLERIVRHREGNCDPVFSTLMLDGEWAALHFGVRAGEVLHYWIPIYNRKFRSLSPGLVLLYKIIEEAGSNNISEIDFGGRASQYKDFFATENYPLYRTIWFRRRVRGLAYHGYLSLGWRLQSMFPGLPELPGSSLP